jgi:hypothetical protein
MATRLAKARQCTAQSKQTGKRCKRPAIAGGTVCHFHGGAAPQVQKAAKERIAAMVDPVLELLERNLAGKLKRARDREGYLAIDKVDYLLMKDILDRAGYKPRIEIDNSAEMRLMGEELAAARDRLAEHYRLEEARKMQPAEPNQ